MNSSAGRFDAAVRGEASVVGVALLLGLTALGTTAVVALGSVALEDTRRQSELQRGEHAMAQFDSRAAQVALGESATQTVDLPGDAGGYSTDPTAGRITVAHINYTETGGVSGEVLYDGSLGAVSYRNGGTVVAYQGGGVWRKDDAGGTRMVSPPEFHYRGGTLTLPVVRVTAGESAAGNVRAIVETSGPSSVRYPNETANYAGEDAPDRTYRNPLSEGYVVVTVESEFYDGWAEYFRERTDGAVTEHPDEQRVTLKLLTKGTTGQFSMPSDQSNGGGTLRVQGIDEGHSLTDFSFTLRPKTDQRSRFKNLRWGMFVENGRQKFELSLRGGGVGCDESVPFVVYYSDDGHRSYQGWTGNATVECDGSGHEIALDLADNSSALTYGPIGRSDLTHYTDDIGTLATGTLAGHPDAAGHDDDRTYDATGSDTERVDFVVAHYFAELGPAFDLETEDQQSGGAAGVDEGNSGGVIEYAGGDRVVTYLHVTDNGIEVRFE